jgi:hypothetical protein
MAKGDTINQRVGGTSCWLPRAAMVSQTRSTEQITTDSPEQMAGLAPGAAVAARWKTGADR